MNWEQFLDKIVDQEMVHCGRPGHQHVLDIDDALVAVSRILGMPHGSMTTSAMDKKGAFFCPESANWLPQFQERAIPMAVCLEAIARRQDHDQSLAPRRTGTNG